MTELMKEVLKPDVIVAGIVIIFLVAGRFIFGMKYTSVKMILTNYMSCFPNRNGKIKVIPIMYYFGLPFLVSIIVAYKKEMNSDIINIITVIVTILTAMLFNILMLAIDMKSKIKNDENYYSMDAHWAEKSLIQTYYAVMFAILISIIILLICLFNVFVKSYGNIQSFLLYYFVSLLLINLFVIMKKIYMVIDADMKK